MAGFDATATRRDATAIIDLRGEINGDADQAMGAAYADATAEKPDAILLRFENVEYINSTGIALIVGLLARARKEEIAVRASGLSEHYRHIFRITRLADFITFEDDGGKT